MERQLARGSQELPGDDGALPLRGHNGEANGDCVAGEAAPGQVVVSGTVRDLVAGSGIEFEELGVRALKGVPGEWRLYALRT